MSSAELIEACLGTRFHLWMPLLPGAHTRVIYVEDRLHSEIVAATDFRVGVLWSDFDRFSLGGLVTVGYGRESTCMIKHLEPPDDEVWEIRSKDPEPGIRVFGRFCGCDQFVATHSIYREDLGFPINSKYEGNHWPQEIQRCKQTWNQICLGEPPHSGSSIHDYISANVVEVGKLP